MIEYPERPELRVVGLVRVVLGGDRRLQRPVVEHVLQPVVEVVVVLKHYQRQPGGGGQLEEQAEQYRPRTPLNAHLTYSLTIVIRVLASGRARGRNTEQQRETSVQRRSSLHAFSQPVRCSLFATALSLTLFDSPRSVHWTDWSSYEWAGRPGGYASARHLAAMDLVDNPGVGEGEGTPPTAPLHLLLLLLLLLLPSATF